MTFLVETPAGHPATNVRAPAVAADTAPPPTDIPTQAVAQSAHDAAEALRCVIDAALCEGWTKDTIAEMVAERAQRQYHLDLDGVAHLLIENGELDPSIIYEELPPGTIDVPTASRKYGIIRNTIRKWINARYVRKVGRLKGRAPGGGYLVVIEDDLIRHKDAPKKKGGRPRKRKIQSR